MAARVLAFDEAAGRDVALRFADLKVGEFLARVAGGSPYLRGLMLREEAFLRAALTRDVQQVVPAEIAMVAGLTVDALAAGVVFEETPRHETYGVVAVWRDPWGNRWDMIQPAD